MMRSGYSLALAALVVTAGSAEARHWQWAFEEEGHASPISSFYAPSASPECLAECEPLANDPDSTADFEACIAKHRCQPLIGPPPNPDVNSGACPEDLATWDDTTFETQCIPFTGRMHEILEGGGTEADVYAKGSCCLQYEIGRQGWRGYQLRFGPYEMTENVNDEFTIGWARVPNAANLDADGATYEYMVGFEFWQHSGSHHFIMDDLLGPYNDPDAPRSCSDRTGADKANCEKFDSLPDTCPSDGDAPATNGGSACSSVGGMQSFPLAGSPGPSYFPVPYPDDVGIKISREHIFRMTHHIQDWYDPQRAQVWINIYTLPAQTVEGEESVDREAHVFFDGSGSVFLAPKHAISRSQGLWVAPRNIELYGLTAHSHKRNVLFTADLIGVDGEVKALPVRQYQYSDPVCGGFRRIASGEDGQPRPDDPVDQSNPPMHLYESTDWAEHEQCPWWREDGDNDRAGAILIRQGEGIRYNCIINNGVLPSQIMTAAGLPPETGDPTVDPALANLGAGLANTLATYPAGTLAHQSVPVEPRDAFGRRVRVKFSCEEIPGLVPGFPGAGALGYYHNRPCTPDVLKGRPPEEDLTFPEGIQATFDGGPAEECDPDDTWTQFRYEDFSGNYTGKCVPSNIGFAETEDDEMCILLGLYAFSDDDVVPIGTNGPLGDYGIDRLPTDVGR